MENGEVKAHVSPKSSALYERAKNVLPGGVSRNTVFRRPHPLYAAKGSGCYVTDIDGVKRVDFANNMASLIHGHAHPAVMEAVSEQLKKGTAFTFGTEAEVLFAELLCRQTESIEMVRFVNSGTEAVMACLKASRAYTGRSKIAKVEGAYHGQYDYAEVSQTAAPSNWGEVENPASVPVARGTPPSVLRDVVIIPYNDIERTLTILDSHAEDLACVMIDLMPHRVGLVPAAKNYIQALYRWTRMHGVLLVFDEVITYRLCHGGAQRWHGVVPDLTALGKLIGGGFPAGAIGGRAEVMEVMNPLSEPLLFPHSGTFSANPITMTAGRITMELFDESAVARLNQLGQKAREGIAEAIQVAGICACVTGKGSMFRVHMKEHVPQNYRAAYMSPKETALITLLLNHLLDNGIMMINTCTGALSTVMTEKEIDTLCEVMLGGFRKIKEAGLEAMG